jgi:transcriptional regulator with XRE-family HTH domain
MDRLSPDRLATPGQRIKWARERCGLSAAALARRLGLTRAAVSQWSSPKKQSFPSRHLQQLSEILGVRAEWLITGRGEALRESCDDPKLLPIGTPLVGVAEAEVWREGAISIEALHQAQPAVFQRLSAAEIASLRPFAIQVRGQSANRSIAPGSYALCVDYRQMRPTGPQTGDLVVVRKSRGSEHKMLIARLHAGDQNWELRYDSLDPHWQRQAGIRLAADLSRDLTDDSTIEIIGFVFAVLSYEPLGSSQAVV